ncbi:MAG TPA: sigma-70 family RNA polymerase sigma factor [Bacteroidota bacterium]|nr:sigma-70 family RNA polymerase sigma factor [Bacteroidota bacterium]
MGIALPFSSIDGRILEGIRTGREEVLVELYRDNRRAVTSLVRRSGGSADDADDILQEALVSFWERVRTGRFTYSARLSTYIYAVARNIWLRRLARVRREVTLRAEEDDPPGEDLSPLEQVMEDEQSQMVRRALERLGEPCKKLLLLYYWEELPMEEIASRLGFANADTAKSKKYQCKKALERLIRETIPRND